MRASKPVRRPWLALLLRAGVAGLAVAFTLPRLELNEVLGAFSRIPLLAWITATALTAGSLLVGAVRWRRMMQAFGAKAIPSTTVLFRHYWVGLFFNTFLPANVGGDVLRGIVTKNAFSGAVYATMVVFFERLYGLSGLCALAALGVLLLDPSLMPTGAGALPAIAAALAVSVALATALLPLAARAISGRMPAVSSLQRVKALLAGVPRVQAPVRLVEAFLLSLVTQTIVAVTVYQLLSPLSPGLPLTTCLLLAPLAMASHYLPSIAGIGVREAAFVVLFGEVGVSPNDATAASLTYFGVQLLVALLGGVIHLWPSSATQQ